jgi:hypothetical protein
VLLWFTYTQAFKRQHLRRNPHKSPRKSRACASHNFVIDTAGSGDGGTNPGMKKRTAAGSFGGIHPSAPALPALLLSSISTACNCMRKPATTWRIAPSSAACALADMRARASCVCSALRSAVSVAESERFAGPVAVPVLVVGEGGVSLVGGGKYAARSAAGSSASDGAGGAAWVITSAGASWCPRHGYGGTVADVGGLKGRCAVVVVFGGGCGKSVAWV